MWSLILSQSGQIQEQNLAEITAASVKERRMPCPLTDVRGSYESLSLSQLVDNSATNCDSAQLVQIYQSIVVVSPRPAEMMEAIWATVKLSRKNFTLPSQNTAFAPPLWKE
jgi:hypothetical protein